MGAIEQGVRSDLVKLGIDEPTTALERQALRLAAMLDDDDLEARYAAGISRELRMTLTAIASKPSPGVDKVGELAAQVQAK